MGQELGGAWLPSLDSHLGICCLQHNPADVCKSPRKVRNVTRQIFHRLFPAGRETKVSVACSTETQAYEQGHMLAVCW